MPNQELLYLSRAEVEACGVTMAEVIAAVEAGFAEHGRGSVEMPPKPGIHPLPDAFIHAMPAYIPGLHSAGLKWVAGYPQNQAKGLPYISGLLILNDPETGLPLAVMDCTWITAMRTGAATAVAAKYLARPESATLGVLACGVQGRANLEALSVLFPLTRVVGYDTSDAMWEKFAAHAESLGLPVTRAAEPREAVAGLDLVVTAGPILMVPHATIQAGWLAPGAFASLVDYDSYWSRAALAEADKFCTDDVAQYEYYQQHGYFQDMPPVYASLGELVAGLKPGRESAGERNLACNLGLALDDMATAPLVYRRALDKGLGTKLEL
jgi:ornithine cyclodeaminase/alanine dehydrogenase